MQNQDHLPFPQGTRGLFFTQIFSTFSFAVLNYTLVLYMTLYLHFSDILATSIEATFLAFNFALHLFGGFIAGRFLSNRLLFIIAMMMQGGGCLIISTLSSTNLYIGLALFLAGSGINTTCMNCMVTQLFEPSDNRRERAFFWNYSGMNLGFFFGITLAGYLQKTNHFDDLFFVTAFSNIFAMIIIFLNWKHLADRKTPLVMLPKTKHLQNNILGFGILALLIPSLFWLLAHSAFNNRLVMIVGASMGIVIAILAMTQPTAEARKKIWAFLILGIASLSFWTLFEMTPMGLTLFIQRNVDRHIGNFIVPAGWFQNIDPFIIMVGGPIFGYIFQLLRKKGFRITVPLQFSLALWFIGFALVILPIGIHFANPQGYVNMNWVVLSFSMLTFGELCIGPIGYAMIGYLAPPKLQGIMMGTWCMLTGVASTLSGHFSKVALGTTNATDPLITNSSFGHTFNQMGWVTVGVGVCIFLLKPFIESLMADNEK